MVKCNICNKYFKRIDAAHLPAKHNITADKYLELFPGSSVISEQTLKKYSTAQKTYATANPEKMKLRAKQAKKTITPEQQKKSLDAIAVARFAKYNEIYGTGSIRNKKISDKTSNRWSNYTTLEKSEITKKSAKTTRERLGEQLYLEMMADKSQKGYKTLVKNGRGSKWEFEMVSKLQSMFSDTIADYRVGGRWYDAFIPCRNLLVEFDGDFWHPKTLNDCQYEFQTRNYYNDQTKNKIANNNGFDLVRIRQSESDKITEIK